MTLDTLNAKVKQLRLILLDIDGTLVTGSASDLANVQFQLRRLRRFGIRFSVATGRTIYGANQVLAELDPDYRVKWLITYNGAVVARRDARALIERLTLSPTDFSRILDVCERLNVCALAYACDPRFDAPNAELVFANYSTLPNASTEFNGMPISRLATLRDAPVGGLVAVLAFDPLGSHNVDALVSQFQDACGQELRVTTSGSGFVEIAHRDGTKRRGTETLCRALGFETAHVMAIGDNFNDIELLRISGLSAAVANSPELVKAACHYICRHEAAAGVVEVLRWLADTLRDNKRCQEADELR